MGNSITISPAGRDDYSAFLALYNEAFPIAERRLYADEHELDAFMASHPAFRMLVIYKDFKFAGFLTWWKFATFAYIEHFAIVPEERGTEMGATMLRHISAVAGLPLLLEVELPDTDAAVRRIAFYSRNGFKLRDELAYTQPPYRKGEDGVPMMIMTKGDISEPLPLCISQIHREVYNSRSAGFLPA